MKPMVGGETGRRTGLLIQQKVFNPPCGFDSHPISHLLVLNRRDSMKKVLVLLMLVALPALAEEVVTSPDQNIENTKSYTGINYNRQDSEQVGTQKIVNDHSWFNININIIKKGALFKKGDVVVGTEEEVK